MFSSLIAGLRALLRRERRNADIRHELDSFLHASIDDKVRHGMSRETALRAARAEIGSAETVRQKLWSAGWESTADSLLQDLRFALRQLRKNPGFALTAILILTLGIAASVAIFSFVDAALIHPLPFLNPARLAILYESNALGPRFHLSYLDYLDWKRQNTVFSSLEAFAPYGFFLQTPEGVENVEGASVSAGFLRMLGVTPILGRDFRPGDDQVNAPRPVLLSYSAWQNRYGGRAGVLGQTIMLDSQPSTIIGVLPPSFHFAPAEPADFWATERADGGCERARACHNLLAAARLKPGVPFSAAQADLTTIAAHLARQYPDSDAGRGCVLVPLLSDVLGTIRPILLVLLAGAALLLLIASVNVASLLLVRAEQRRREMAVRGALGASRSRLVRQFVTEGAVLALASGSLGLALAALVMHLFLGLIPVNVLATMPYLRSIGLNPHVLLFTALVSLAAGVLFSLLPALRVSLSDLRDNLSEGGRTASTTLWRRFGANLVVLELAMAVVLLTGAGLLGKSFYRLLHVDTGLDAGRLALLQVAATGPSYSKSPQQIALEHRLQDALSALPGVESVAFTSRLPLGNGNGSIDFSIVGAPPARVPPEVPFREISSTYFPTLHARIAAGRWFTATDDAAHPPVVIINRQMAREYFPHQDPVGRQISTQGVQKMQVVGVVDDLQEGQLDAPPRGAMYIPFDQSPSAYFAVVLRAARQGSALLGPAAASIHSVDRGLVVSHPDTMAERIHDSPAAALHRSSAWIVGGFALLALLLSTVGLYGVVAYSVSQRTREIGVRMALGAKRSSVYQMVLREAGKLAVFGISVGLIAALAATTLLRSLLFDVRSWDLATLTTVALVLAASALLASFIPARRAASVNPTEALRAE